MSAATQKGNQYENEAKRCLEAAGWSIFRQHRRPMFMRGRMITVGADIFGCDIVARDPERKRLLLWVQVGTLSNKSHKFQQVKDVPWQFEHEQVQVWLREPGKKRFQVYQLGEVSGVRAFLRTDDAVVPRDTAPMGDGGTNEHHEEA